MKCFSILLMVTALSLAGFLSACGQEPQSQSASVTPQISAAQVCDAYSSQVQAISLTPPNLSCDTPAQYLVVFNGSWSALTHPTDFPVGGHFTIPVGLTHNSNFSLWTIGGLATPGVRATSETGNTVVVSGEINNAISSLNGGSLILANSGAPGTGCTGTTFSATKDYPLVSMLSMIGPSTNWFVGVDSVNLCQNGAWVNSQSVDSYPYTAGADSGMTYRSPRIELTPHIPIALILDYPFLNNNTVAPLGTFTFFRM